MLITVRHDRNLRTNRRALRVVHEAAADNAAHLSRLHDRGDCSDEAYEAALAAAQIAEAVYNAAVFAPHPEVTHIEVMVDAR